VLGCDGGGFRHAMTTVYTFSGNSPDELFRR
jgi:hypothetical protein